MMKYNGKHFRPRVNWYAVKVYLLCLLGEIAFMFLCVVVWLNSPL